MRNMDGYECDNSLTMENALKTHKNTDILHLQVEIAQS